MKKLLLTSSAILLPALAAWTQGPVETQIGKDPAPAAPATGTNMQSQSSTATNVSTTPRPAMTAQDWSKKLLRSRDLDGAVVHDRDGKLIGTVDELLIDENTGRIYLAALDIGQGLGTNKDDVLVSWSQLKRREREAGFVLSSDAKMLRSAPSVDSWDDKKNHADLFRKAVQHWGGQDAGSVKLVRASEARDAELFDTKGNKIGKIEGLMIDPLKGSAVLAVIELEKSPHGDRDTAAVPFSQVRESPQKTPGYVLSIAPSNIGADRFFSESDWPDFNDPKWGQSATSAPTGGNQQR